MDQQTLDYIIENYGKVSLQYMAKKFNTTPVVIEKIAFKHQLGGMKSNQGLVSLNYISKCIDVCSKTVKKWTELENNPLPSHKLPNSFKTKKRKYDIYGIDPVEFWKWAKNNLHRFDIRNYTPLSLLPEPEWLDEALSNARKNPTYIKRRYWTEQEDEQLWYLFYNLGKTHKEIAARLNKTEISVCKRLSRLRKIKFKEIS